MQALAEGNGDAAGMGMVGIAVGGVGAVAFLLVLVRLRSRHWLQTVQAGSFRRKATTPPSREDSGDRSRVQSLKENKVAPATTQTSSVVYT